MAPRLSESPIWQHLKGPVDTGSIVTGELMLTRVVVFFALVFGMAGATAGMGLIVTETGSACHAYKTC